MYIPVITIGSAVILLAAGQLFACRKVRNLWSELCGHREALISNRKTLHATYVQEERFKNRLDDVWAHPSISDNPEWEIDSCTTMLDNMPEHRSELKAQIKHHNKGVRRTIRRIRRWQKILIRP